MTKKQIIWVIYNVVFVLPIVLYLTINFYWWLFDGNILQSEKMGAATCVLLTTAMVSGAWADFNDVWRRQ